MDYETGSARLSSLPKDTELLISTWMKLPNTLVSQVFHAFSLSGFIFYPTSDTHSHDLTLECVIKGTAAIL